MSTIKRIPTLKEYLELFDEEIRPRIAEHLNQPETLGGCRYENLAMDSSAFGRSSHLPIGPQWSTLKTIEQITEAPGMGVPLGQTPSQFQYPVAIYVKADEPPAPVKPELPVGAWPRCHDCPACIELAKARKITIPNPPFSHGSDGTVQFWNTQLMLNPCEYWTTQQKVEFVESFDKLSEAIRPPELYRTEARIKVGLEQPE